MQKFLGRVVWRILKAVLYCALGAAVTLVVAAIFVLNNKPDLEIWHVAKLDEEFTAKSQVTTFAEYLELEDRLFAQLDTEVCDKLDEADRSQINRFNAGSLSDPGRWPTNWNRSYELAVDAGRGGAKAGVLLIHGLSDSPYSLRNIGASLNAAGAHVVGLRVPGHGTAPASLTRTRWKDMTSAVEIAMRHLAEVADGRPLYLVGSSNGAALAVKYGLSAIEDEALPNLDGIVLISPQIGVTPVAGLAVWQERAGRLLGLRKLSWKSVLLEYDPFKYGSFPINAGKVAYELTKQNRSALGRLAKTGKLGDFPPVLCFQSVVDATVSARAVVDDLFALLPENGHELVAIGLNRTIESEPILRPDLRSAAYRVTEDPSRSFVFTLLANATPESLEVAERKWGVGEVDSIDRPLGLSWPERVYSLSHVALPFPENDPLYGSERSASDPGVHIGDVSLRGERDVILIPAGELLRQRWNPFYPYLEARILDRLGLAG